MIHFLALLGCPDPGPDTEAPPEASSALPDVVFITLDTTRADRLGAYGYAGAHTPVIDALASKGRRYNRAYSPMPLTIPAHATLFTGQQPPTHGLRSNGSGRLPDEAETLAEQFQANGYQTAGSVAAFVTTSRWGLDQGFDAYFDAIAEEANYWESQRPAEEVIDDLLAWKVDSDADAPKFVWAHLYDPHYPYVPRDAFLEKTPNRPYDAEIAYMDSQIGRLVEAFSNRPTLFVLAGDHGESLGEHGELTHGLFVYDATQRVPLIVSGVGVEPSVVEETVSLADVAPTLLDLVGLPPLPKAEGRIAPGSQETPVYMESYQLTHRFGFAPHVAVVSEGKKYISTPRPELYAVGTDETENLAGSVDVGPWRTAMEALAYKAPDDAELHLDPAVASQLEALGYVEPSAAKGDGPLPDPKDHRALLSRAQQVDKFALLGKMKEAEAALKSLSTDYPEIAEFKNRRSKILSELGRVDEAMALVEEIREKDPDNPILKQSYATLLTRKGDFAQASILYQEVARDLPELPRARSSAFGALEQAGEHEAAVLLAEGYLQEFPEDRSLAGVLGLSLVKHGEIGTGTQLLDIGAAAARPERDVCHHLGAVVLGTQKPAEALDLFQRELKFWPDNTPARFAMVRTMATLTKDQEALLEEAQLLLKVAPKSPEAHYWVAQALFNLKRDDEVMATVRAGQVFDPSYPKLMILHANVLARAGKSAEGKVLYDQATEETRRRAAAMSKKKKKTPQ